MRRFLSYLWPLLAAPTVVLAADATPATPTTSASSTAPTQPDEVDKAAIQDPRARSNSPSKPSDLTAKDEKTDPALEFEHALYAAVREALTPEDPDKTKDREDSCPIPDSIPKDYRYHYEEYYDDNNVSFLIVGRVYAHEPITAVEIHLEGKCYLGELLHSYEIPGAGMAASGGHLPGGDADDSESDNDEPESDNDEPEDTYDPTNDNDPEIDIAIVTPLPQKYGVALYDDGDELHLLSIGGIEIHDGKATVVSP